MKSTCYLKRLIGVTLMIISFVGCTKEELPSDKNGLLKEVLSAGSVIEKYTYNENNLLSEANSTYFWMKYYYNNNNQLIREEIGVDPDIYSSSFPRRPHDKLANPSIVDISMFTIYNYDNSGRLIKVQHYIPGKSQVELRSSRTFEYNNKNLIYKELLHNGSNEVTQFRTYNYDNNGNVIEEDYYSYLFIQEQSSPKHLSKTVYEYDSYLNPYRIFNQLGHPGTYTNVNNILKTVVNNYEPAAGIDSISLFEHSFEYNNSTGYPIKSDKGIEYIYQ